MTDWDGRGLPPVAAQRIARAASSGVRTSLLSAPAAVSLGTVGLDPVGEVMGCIVEHVGWSGPAGCGVSYGSGGLFLSAESRTIATRQSRWTPYRPYVDAVRRGYATAMSRLVQEAVGLGADGIVGIRLTVSQLEGAREFTALGTAVRARSNVRPTRPFTTDLPGTDVAKLMVSGWMPSDLLVAFEVGIRHDNWLNSSRFRSPASTEVKTYTELTQHVRGLVRSDIRKLLVHWGADGFVSSAIDLRVSAVEAGENHRDHVAEALMVGTALVRFRRSSAVTRPEPLTVMPVSRTGTTMTRPMRRR